VQRAVQQASGAAGSGRESEIRFHRFSENLEVTKPSAGDVRIFQFFK